MQRIKVKISDYKNLKLILFNDNIAYYKENNRLPKNDIDYHRVEIALQTYYNQKLKNDNWYYANPLDMYLSDHFKAEDKRPPCMVLSQDYNFKSII